MEDGCHVTEAGDDEDDIADSWETADNLEEQEVLETEKEDSKPKTQSSSKKITEKTPSNNLETAIDHRQRMLRLQQESDLDNAIALFGISKSDVNVDEILAPIKVNPIGTTIELFLIIFLFYF